MVEAFPRGALRPPRPWQIGRAEGPLFHGAVRPRRAGGGRRSQDQEIQLVRPVDGRHGRTMARRQCARPRREADPVQHQFQLRRQGRRGTTASNSCRKRVLAELVDPNMERWFTKGFRERAPQIDRAHEGDVPRHQSGRLHRQLRSDPRHGFHRVQSAHHRADAGDRRQAGSGDAAGRRRSDRQADQGRQARRARRRAYLQHRAAEALYRDGAQLPASPRGVGDGREGTPRTKAWPSAARCWAMPGSIAPTPRRRRSTRSSRTSSRAPPGARSGRGRITTSARAASW